MNPLLPIFQITANYLDILPHLQQHCQLTVANRTMDVEYCPGFFAKASLID